MFDVDLVRLRACSKSLSLLIIKVGSILPEIREPRRIIILSVFLLRGGDFVVGDLESSNFVDNDIRLLDVFEDAEAFLKWSYAQAWGVAVQRQRLQTDVDVLCVADEFAQACLDDKISGGISSVWLVDGK